MTNKEGLSIKVYMVWEFSEDEKKIPECIVHFQVLKILGSTHESVEFGRHTLVYQ